MKRISPYLFYIVLFLGLHVFSSCEENEYGANYIPSQTEGKVLYAETKELKFSSQESMQRLCVYSWKIPWRITSSEDWVMVSSTSGTTSEELTIQVSANNSISEDRTCILTLSSTDLDTPITCSIRINQEHFPYILNGHSFVDLGLTSGTLWATMNVGATSESDFGDYFAWGETSGYNSGKKSFIWSSYKWNDGFIIKYCTDNSYGTVDNKTELDIADDAARANWGGSWMMPTWAQIQELKKECTWTWTMQGGNYGCEVTSKKNRKSIFLPAAGYAPTSLNSVDPEGNYWSCSLGRDSYYAHSVSFSSDGISRGTNISRYQGCSIRPVLSK